MLKLIGISGARFSGKSKVAEAVQSELGFEIIPLSDPLKRMLLALGLTHEQLYGNKKEEPSDLICGKTSRWGMQSLGREWGRECIGPDIWVNAWEARYKSLNNVNVVCDDVRFPNEVDMIKNLGGKVICIRRPEVEGGASHESEIYAGSLDVHKEFFNTSDLRTVQQEVINYIRTGE